MTSLPRLAAAAVLVLQLALAGCGGGGGGGSGGGGGGGGGGNGDPPPPLTGAGAYESGTYPDLFVDLLGKTPPEVQARIEAAFQQLFYGSDSSERVYYPVAPDMAYMLDTGNNDVRSEGMSYGMMIAVQLDKHAEFDRLWKFARTYMWQPSGQWQDYFAWHTDTSGNKLSQSPASDGEEWFATALLLAANRWGAGGIFDYQAEAQRILDVMLHKEEQADRGAATSMFDAATHQVVFVPSGTSATFTDPSYHLPHFYELWARWGNKDQAFWCAAASASRAFFPTAADPTTGLSPDYAHFDGTPNDVNQHGAFRFDAHRVASNIALDYLWFRSDPWEVEQSDRLLSFFHARKGAEGGTYSNQYTLAGSPIGSPHGPGLTGMNAAAALAASDGALRTEFVQDLWNAATPTGQYRYYDGLLYLLGLLEVSGNFRVYQPPGGPVAACP